MKIYFKAIIHILTVFIYLSTQAQKNRLDNRLAIEIKRTGIIEQQNKVKGYYSFYFVEKADIENAIYMIKIFDENAREIISEKFKEANNMKMIAAAFDNEAILLKFQVFINTETVTKYYIFNQSKQLKLIVKPTSNKDDGRYSMNISGSETLNYGLYAIQKKGFFNYAPYLVNKSHGYEIFHIDSEGNKKWLIQSQTKPKERDIAKILLASKNNLYSIISNYQKESRFKAKKGNHILQYINCIDIETGKKRFETKLEDNQYRYQVLSGQESELGENIIIYGLYYLKTMQMDKIEPLGIFTANIGPNGSFTDIKHILLDNSIDKYFHSENYRSISSIGNIYFHNIFHTADKKIYAVAQNYKVMHDRYDRSIIEFATKDLFIFECTSNFTLEAIKNFSLPQIKMYTKYSREVSFYKTATRAKSEGLFGYLFTQLSPDRSSFIIGYINTFEERKIKTLSTPATTITSVNYGAIIHKGSTYLTDKISLKSGDDILSPLNAKYGHVLVTGLLRDKKKQEIRLEKINY